jgi:hypothetical protein
VQDDEDARKTRELARCLEAHRDSRMLSPEEIAALREDAKRARAQSRAEYARLRAAAGALAMEYARRARYPGHVVPPWLIEEAWQVAWDAELPPGRLEEIQGGALRRLSLRVRMRVRQMTRDTMDVLYPRRG